MSSSYLICALITILITLITRYLRSLAVTTVLTHSSLSTIQQLINPPGATSHELLTARAIPNQRLVRAFALTNTFVSADSDVHERFITHANLLLRAATRRGWHHLQDVIIQATDSTLLEGVSVFDAFVQSVTLRVALISLLGVDANPADLDPCDIGIVGSLITQLWSLSKKPDHISPELLTDLNHHLRRLVPDRETYQNPLDYVIPVWETLWRVVATTIAYAHRDEPARQAFANLHDHPTTSQFRTFEPSGYSAEAVITETMRLHPPTKRIARATSHEHPALSILPSCIRNAIKNFSGSIVQQECADIGSALRSHSIWGPSADKFDPSRHHPSRALPEQEATKLLPFGYGRHRCIASSWAPMAAGVITAALLDRIQEGKGYKLVIGTEIGGREGWKDWSITK